MACFGANSTASLTLALQWLTNSAELGEQIGSEMASICPSVEEVGTWSICPLHVWCHRVAGQSYQLVFTHRLMTNCWCSCDWNREEDVLMPIRRTLHSGHTYQTVDSTNG